MEKITFTIEEAVKAGPIERSKLYELINEGQLPARKLGRRTFILVEDYKRLLESMPTIQPPTGRKG